MNPLELLKELTLIQVGMRSEEPLFRHEFAKRVNVDLGALSWILVDNDAGNLMEKMSDLPANFHLGDSHEESIKRFGLWSHSLHHASALDLAMKCCSTKYALITDPDFVVVDWGAVGVEFLKFKGLNLDFLGTPWFPIYPEKKPLSVAPHMCFVNIDQLRSKQFSWCDGIVVRTSNSYQNIKSFDTGTMSRSDTYKIHFRKFLRHFLIQNSFFRLLIQIRHFYIVRSTIGIDPDTGSSSAEDAYTKDYFLPMLGERNLRQISTLFKYRFVRALERLRAPQSRLLNRNWVLLNQDINLMVGGKDVELFASTRGEVIGFHVRAYNSLVREWGFEDIMAQLHETEINVSALRISKNGEL